MRKKILIGIVAIAVIALAVAVVIIREPETTVPRPEYDRPLALAPEPNVDLPVAVEMQVSTIAGTGSHGARDDDLGEGIAQFNLPGGIFGGAAGQLLVADTYNNLIRGLETSVVHRVSGDILGYDEFRFPMGFYRDGAQEYALFNRPTDGVMTSAGLFIVDSTNHAIRLIDEGRVYTFAGGPSPGHRDGHVNQAQFNYPTAIAADSEGNLYIADTLNHVIRRIDSYGNVTTIAGIPGSAGYVNGPAEQALFSSPMGIAVSKTSGAIYIADTENHVIRGIADGRVSTLAGSYTPYGGFADGEQAMFTLPVGLALYGDTLIIADSGNHRIRALMYDAQTITIAGTGYPDYINGSGSQAAFHFPRGVHVRGDELFIADSGNNIIRKVLLELS